MTDNACGCRAHGLSYMAWFADCDRRRKAGQVQVWCEVCRLWRWPDEVGPAAKTLTQAQFERRMKREG